MLYARFYKSIPVKPSGYSVRFTDIRFFIQSKMLIFAPQ